MPRNSLSFLGSAAAPAALLALSVACTQPVLETRTTASRAVMPDSLGYEVRPAQDPNGIGKYYQGRQIAHVMGHEGAGWLERADRDREEGTDILLRELHLKPTDVVADLGAGTGYFTFRISPLVPRGKVLAVDIQPEMLEALQQTKVRTNAVNVQPVLGTVQNPNLPAKSVDLVLIVDAYHEFDHPREIMQAVRTALRPGGRVALVEYRAEDPNVAIKRIHKMSVAQARKEMEAVGLEYVQTIESLPQQHLLIFRKK
ncbi:class I SAM-dependent methyltransferase [Hymenobacter sp. J193]|uniref:class I SAM-dependent methyltransferase n=1 Tax=Hymenobacter sp. J193 TaxID=2898429 RepID=UPI002150D1EC|nr:class I SAM-dependent methyltransferase [Hymenobacter sp. J193]MCR5888957.1 class I SAM-dependent methyltransferase [Hymenobacter sp. J193]